MSPARRSVLDSIPADLANRPELIDILAESSHVRIERIVSRGHSSSPDFWYDQDETEWVMLVAGRARLRFAPDRVLELGPGEHVLIPAHERHRVDWTDPSCDTIWIAVYFFPASS